MVNRVFSYSQEVALKYNNKPPVLKLILSIVLFFPVFVLVLTLVMISFQNMPYGITAFLILVVAALTLAPINIFAYKVYMGVLDKTIGFATDDNDNLYMVKSSEIGQESMLGGLTVGSVLSRENEALGDASAALGTAFMFHKMNKTAEIMSHPEIIAKMVECADSTTSADVIRIIKVLSFKEYKDSFKIKYYGQYVKSGKNKTKKKIITKSYTSIDELKNILINKQNAQGQM